jgi:hypothetical protein
MCADLNTEFIPAWFSWAQMPIFYQEIINYLKSQFYAGIQIFPLQYEFKADAENQELVKISAEINKQSENVELGNLHANLLWIDASSNLQNNPQEVTNQEVSLLVKRKDCKNIWGIEFKTSETFEILKLPKFLNSLSDSEIADTSCMNVELLKAQKEEVNNSVNSSDIKPEPLQATNYELVSILLILSLIVFILDIFLKR